MGKIETRKVQLLEYLEKKGKLSVAEIADMHGISLPSARRVCAQLEKERRVMRIHGGIRYVPAITTTYSFTALDTEYNAEKEAIARNACQLVKNNQNIFLESGTTVKHFAMALAARIRKGEISDISVFTNSLANLEILTPICRVTIVGGLYRPESRDFCGFLCEKMIRTLHFDICFIGADALNMTDGIMAMDVESVRYNELLIERSDQSIILVHSEKFYRHSLIAYCTVHDVSGIITDSKLSPELLRDYQEAGINIVCA
ncbi:MAG: DeoR/GlpR family DNA-binding transcription regulator [Treponema sp.]|jgi:DeoR/GlpR family transcriptional regulator of sugar metabolism|nr:DeoR/GlpR family DNA-binding transcription regulator [Treponema sp.]